MAGSQLPRMSRARGGSRHGSVPGPRCKRENCLPKPGGALLPWPTPSSSREDRAPATGLDGQTLRGALALWLRRPGRRCHSAPTLDAAIVAGVRRPLLGYGHSVYAAGGQPIASALCRDSDDTQVQVCVHFRAVQGRVIDSLVRRGAVRGADAAECVRVRPPQACQRTDSETVRHSTVDEGAAPATPSRAQGFPRGGTRPRRSRAAAVVACRGQAPGFRC